jgi:hypothetical protein
MREGRICALESELNRFYIKDDESPQDMYNHLNKIINKITSLGSTRWGRREVFDKILSAYMARDYQLATLIREKRGFDMFTPADVIGRMEEHLITVKESKLSQEMSKMHEQQEKNKGCPSRHLARIRNLAHQPPRPWSRKIVMKIVM